MEISLKYKSDNEYEATNASGNVVAIDMLPKGEKKALSPTELLLSATAACAAVDIVGMIKKRRRTFIDISSVASGERNETAPKKFNSIHVKYIITSPDLEENEAERFVDLAVSKYCSVASSLDPNIKMTHSVEIIRG